MQLVVTSQQARSFQGLKIRKKKIEFFFWIFDWIDLYTQNHD